MGFRFAHRASLADPFPLPLSFRIGPKIWLARPFLASGVGAWPRGVASDLAVRQPSTTHGLTTPKSSRMVCLGAAHPRSARRFPMVFAEHDSPAPGEVAGQNNPAVHSPGHGGIRAWTANGGSRACQRRPGAAARTSTCRTSIRRITYRNVAGQRSARINNVPHGPSGRESAGVPRTDGPRTSCRHTLSTARPLSPGRSFDRAPARIAQVTRLVRVVAR